jgi:hypothetical protein
MHKVLVVTSAWGGVTSFVMTQLHLILFRENTKPHFLHGIGSQVDKNGGMGERAVFSTPRKWSSAFLQHFSGNRERHTRLNVFFMSSQFLSPSNVSILLIPQVKKKKKGTICLHFNTTW